MRRFFYAHEIAKPEDESDRALPGLRKSGDRKDAGSRSPER